MMVRRGVLGLLAGSAAAMLVACNTGNSIRYKITIEVKTPEGVRSGFAVREVTYKPASSGWFPLGEAKGSAKLRGEAVVIDLPEGKSLFALLTSGEGDLNHAAMDLPGIFHQLNSDQVQLWPDPPQLREPIIANPLPMLVTFVDIDDPKSVELVDPVNIAASFGAGVKLTRIVIERTREPVTTGIAKRLKWLPAQKGALLKIPIADYPPSGTPLPIATNITEVDFSQGDLK